MSEETSVKALWTSHNKVRDRVVEIDKIVSVHETLHERTAREMSQMNSNISTQFGKIEQTLEKIESNQEALKGEQSYRKGAINMLAWGIGLFCTVASLAIAYWAVTSRLG
jgi:hypothetical protein